MTLQEQRASLLAAIAQGVHEFRDQNGERVTYASGKEMRDALALLDAEIAGQRPAIIYPTTSKGLDR